MSGFLLKLAAIFDECINRKLAEEELKCSNSTPRERLARVTELDERLAARVNVIVDHIACGVSIATGKWLDSRTPANSKEVFAEKPPFYPLSNGAEPWSTLSLEYSPEPQEIFVADLTMLSIEQQQLLLQAVVKLRNNEMTPWAKNILDSVIEALFQALGRTDVDSEKAPAQSAAATDLQPTKSGSFFSWRKAPSPAEATLRDNCIDAEKQPHAMATEVFKKHLNMLVDFSNTQLDTFEPFDRAVSLAAYVQALTELATYSLITVQQEVVRAATCQMWNIGEKGYSVSNEVSVTIAFADGKVEFAAPSKTGLPLRLALDLRELNPQALRKLFLAALAASEGQKPAPQLWLMQLQKWCFEQLGVAEAVTIPESKTPEASFADSDFEELPQGSVLCEDDKES